MTETFMDENFENVYNNSYSDFNNISLYIPNFNSSNSKVNWLYFFNLEDEITFYISVGFVSLVVLILIGTIALIIYRKKHPVRPSFARNFDTFQNPIYEKAVLPVEIDTTEIDKTKAELEDISDSTVLE